MKILSAIYVYPIKSLGGSRLEACLLEKRGLAFDRRWMLVDENGLFISQREFPELALLQATVERGALQVKDRSRRMRDFTMLLEQAQSGGPVEVQVWDDHTAALDLGQEASDWFSEAIRRPCRLVYMPEETRRPVDQVYGNPGDITSFSDGFPFLIATESSLEDLNHRLGSEGAPAVMERFRPNLVIRGGTAWEEDAWAGIQIGSATFRTPKPCARCQVVTIDPSTGIPGKEPLRTLSTFRKTGHKVLFGINACWDSTDEASPMLRIGDAVKVLL